MHSVPRFVPNPATCGPYRIVDLPYTSDRHGPFVLRLEPLPGNEMFGRSGFLIHGDSKSTPGTASLGWIILQRAVREEVWRSEDRRLKVDV